MTVFVTIGDAPDDIRDVLTAQAREHGQSLQALPAWSDAAASGVRP
ncbi:hypothetical protein [Salinactinospora qingdaonensis]